MSDKKYYTMFHFGNDGHGVVTHVTLLYGDIYVLKAKSDTSYGPVHAVTDRTAIVAPLPGIAKISWVSVDGQEHVVDAPMQSLVDDLDRFYGYKILFVDDHVDVYVIHVKNPRAEYIDTYEEKNGHHKRIGENGGH